jgi:hypothetical protein
MYNGITVGPPRGRNPSVMENESSAVLSPTSYRDGHNGHVQHQKGMNNKEYKPQETTDQSNRYYLFCIHTFALFLHIVSTIVVLVLTVVIVNDNPDGHTTYAVYDYVSEWNSDTMRGAPNGRWDVVFHLSLPSAIIAFELFTIAAETYFVHHLKDTKTTVYSKDKDNVVPFLRNIYKGRNPVRWLEYFFSAATMMGIIAYFCGVKDVTTLVAVVVLTSITQVFGFFAEEWAYFLRKSKSETDSLTNSVFEDSTCRRLIPHLFGWVPQLSAWGLVFARFSIADANTNYNMPGFVRVIVGTQFVLFISFGGVQLYMLWFPLTQKRAVNSEAAYACLSAVAKLLLVWILFANVFF